MAGRAVLRPWVFIASWVVASVELWILAVLQLPEPSGIIARDEDTRAAAVNFYPPTIVAMMVLAAIGMAIVVWPCLLALFALGRRGGDHRYWRALPLGLGLLLLPGGVWALIIGGIEQRLGRVVAVWAELVLFGLLPLVTSIVVGYLLGPAWGRRPAGG